ncbi:hypothetical protein ACVXG9_18315 [Escherichia coli]
MVNLALWLKKHRFRLTRTELYPSPLVVRMLDHHDYTGKTCWRRLVIRVKTSSYRRVSSVVCIKRCCVTTIGKLAVNPPGAGSDGQKHLIGSRRDCLVPAPTIEEMREARRQNRNTRPALTEHTPMATQRQTPATAKKASSTQSRPVNAGAKKRLKRRLDVKKSGNDMLPGFFYHSAYIRKQRRQSK